MKSILFLWLFVLAVSAKADCPLLSMMSSLPEEQQLWSYKLCAENYNDDASQAKLASLYDRGTTTITKNIKKALFYYQLSADNGNAVSQGRLAELYMQLDKSPENRAILYDYMGSVVPTVDGMKQNDFKRENDFKGELIHPYVLLVLANEKAENKWYYPTEVKEPSPSAKMLYKNYKIDEEKKKQLMKQATAWKKRKLLEIAKQVLSEVEYQTFIDTLYPKTGYGDAFQRNQALQIFQEKVNQRRQQDLENAKTFY